MSFVYQVTRRETGKRYVGVSSDPTQRWHQHESSAKRGSRARFHLAVAKYGFNAFDWEVKAELPTQDEALIAERILIAIEHPRYNANPGGAGATPGKAKSAEHAAKIGAAHVGMKRSAEARANMSAAQRAFFAREGSPLRGRTHTAETRAKISATKKGCKGHPQSAETRAKISATKRALYASRRAAGESQ